MKKIALLIGLLFIRNISLSQNLTFYGLLPAINQTDRISKKVNYNLFVSTTIDAFNQKINSVEYPATDLQFYLQPSIIYVHSTNLNFAGSYTYQRNNPFNGNFVNEHRLWQQHEPHHYKRQDHGRGWSRPRPRGRRRHQPERYRPHLP